MRSVAGRGYEPKHLALIRPCEWHLSDAQQRAAGEIDRLAAVDDGDDDVGRQERNRASRTRWLRWVVPGLPSPASS